MIQVSENSTVAEVIEATKQFMDSSGMKQAHICRAIGTFQPAQFSQWINGKMDYPDGCEKIKVELVHYMRTYEMVHNQVTIETEYVQTNQSLNIIGILSLCHMKKKTGRIIGPAGIGKTATIDHYLETNKMSRKITAYFGYTQTAFLMDVQELDIFKNIEVKRKGNDGRMRSVIELLKGSNILLIIDEAQHMNFKLIETVRHICDMSGIGVVFVGNEATYGNVSGKKVIMLDQISSRTTPSRKLKDATPDEDVKKILESINVDIEYKKEAFDYLIKKANGRGHYRIMLNLLEQAVEMLPKGSKTLDLETLKRAEVFLWN